MAGLALQKLIRSRLTADPIVTALVPADAIFDVSDRPERFPCINIGEGQEQPGDVLARRYFKAFASLHVWTREAGLSGAKTIGEAVREALRVAPNTITSVDGYRVLDLTFGGARFMRDPDGVTGHGVVTIEALVEAL